MIDYANKFKIHDRLMNTMREKDLNVTDVSRETGLSRVTIYRIINNEKIALKSVLKMDKWMTDIFCIIQ